MGAMKSKSEQLEEYLLSEIRNRVYKAGDKLPSETRLQQKFGISRVTIRNSLKKLTDQGYIYSVKGCGWFVSGSISERLYQSPQNDALKKIGIVFPHKIEFFKSLYTFLQTECKSNGFQWEFFFNTSIQSEKNAFDFFVKEKFDAVILSPNREYFDNTYKNFEILYRNKMPFIMIGKPPNNIFCNAVYYDDIAGCISLVRELYYRKCKNIIHVTSLYCDQEAVRERREGYIYGMKKFYPNSPHLILNVNISNFKQDFSGFIENFEGRLGIILHDNAEYPSIHAILQRYAQEKDIVLVGFNAPPEMKGKEKISSIEHNISQLAQKSVDLLSYNFFNKTSSEEIRHVVLKPQIFIR